MNAPNMQEQGAGDGTEQVVDPVAIIDEAIQKLNDAKAAITGEEQPAVEDKFGKAGMANALGIGGE